MNEALPGGGAASPPACAIGAFIGLHGQEFIYRTRIWLGSRIKNTVKNSVTGIQGEFDSERGYLCQVDFRCRDQKIESRVFLFMSRRPK